MVPLYDYQKQAVKNMKNGCILCGKVGSGKSRTALAYYITSEVGDVYPDNNSAKPRDLYIITTAKKRDTAEWDQELLPFFLSQNKDINPYHNTVVIDSWNCFPKYIDVKDSFFILDEQRLVGKGAWVKTFLKIAKNNKWIMLSGTPGDNWSDYEAVFIANCFYRNFTDFENRHFVYDRYAAYPKIKKYIDIDRLCRLREKILVDMDYEPHTVAHHINVVSEYDKEKYKWVMSEKKNPETRKPFRSASELLLYLRKIVNSDDSRTLLLLEIFEKKPKIIVFYSFDYELEILKNIFYGEDVEIAEWNGHQHNPIPSKNRWVYLVQYTAGAEGWNCITTDTIVFYSQQYSYKILAQACGRIDRLNSPYNDLYYYHILSSASIDRAIHSALSKKRNFNIGRFAKNTNLIMKQ